MRRRGILSLSAGLVLLAGCLTIHNAREAQRGVAAVAAGERTPGEKLSLVDYSLRELVDFAMTNRPSMAAAAWTMVDARLALLEIQADAPLASSTPWNAPHLALSGGHSASSSADNRLHWNTEGGASASLSLEVLLYDFGRHDARLMAQAENLIAAEYAFIKAGYQVFDEVSTAYFAWYRSHAMLEVAFTNEVEFAMHLQRAEERLKAGEAQQLDVTRARLDLAQARQVTVAASNTVATAGADLMCALGLDADTGSCAMVYPVDGGNLQVLMRGFSETKYDTRDAFDLAVTNAPSVSIARANLRAASAGVDYAIADLKPSVSASLSINWADPLWVWHWGVSAAQSIFEGFRKTTAVDRAVVKLESAASDVDAVEQALSQSISLAIAERDNAAEQLRAAETSVRLARENLDIVKVRYLEGEASRVDFTDALSDYATALGTRVRAFYTGQIAEAKLFALLGLKPVYCEETVKETL